jgi:hypothetical protein
MNYSITQNGKSLDPSKYTICEKTKTFSTNEDGLVLDFNGLYGWSFKTGSGCTFDTGANCTFDTGSNCTFDTGSGCTFDTGSNCTFKTGFSCTFKTGFDCTFDTRSCCLLTVGENCVIVRRDIFDVIQPEPNKTIKLNGYGVTGFVVVEPEEPTLTGKEVSVTIDGQTYTAIIQ